MTEKRFKLEEKTINHYNRNGIFMEYFDLETEYGREQTVDALNQLNDENEQLKSDRKQAVEQCTFLNKELQTMQEEIKDFQDLLANKEEELLKPVIALIDEKIEEVPNIVVMGSSISKTLVEQLKSIYRKEYVKLLEELKKELME